MQKNNPADILQTEHDNNLLYNHKRAQGICTLRFFVCGNIKYVKTNVPRGTNLSFNGLKREKQVFCVMTAHILCRPRDSSLRSE